MYTFLSPVKVLVSNFVGNDLSKKVKTKEGQRLKFFKNYAFKQ